MSTQAIDQGLGFISLELTGRCQLRCEHCYSSSGPAGTHGTMTAADWTLVIDQAAGLGVQTVQFIGGEATLHPDLPALARHALASGAEVEVFTNLYRVPPAAWELFTLPRLRLATSYYSDDPAEHDVITGRPGSHARTLAGIREALRRGIPLRAGVISMRDGQRTEAAANQLRQLGVAKVDHDQLREIGRGVRDRGQGVDQLCGRCGDRKLAVSPAGEVWPCTMARWMPLGQVRQASLAHIYQQSAQLRRDLQRDLGILHASGSDGGCEAPVCCDPHYKQK